MREWMDLVVEDAGMGRRSLAARRWALSGLRMRLMVRVLLGKGRNEGTGVGMELKGATWKTRRTGRFNRFNNVQTFDSRVD
jgi:hypothetical protein